MFKSTYAHVSLRHQWGEPTFHRWLKHMTMDFVSGVQLFEIGSWHDPDCLNEKIYCLKRGEQLIPFTANAKTSKEGRIPLHEFNVRQHRYLHPLASIPVVHIEVSNIGCHPDALPELPRGSAFFVDVWQSQKFSVMSFPSAIERKNIFQSIQEALPVLCFDNYEGVQPNPSICRHISSRVEEWAEVADSSGELEKSSVVLHAPVVEPESPSLVLTRLQTRSDEAALRIEDIFVELLDVERGFLFYGNLFIDVIVNDTRIWEILRKSYNEFYSDDYDCFEKFLLLVVGQIKSRQYARQVYQNYSKFLAV